MKIDFFKFLVVALCSKNLMCVPLIVLPTHEQVKQVQHEQFVRTVTKKCLRATTAAAVLVALYGAFNVRQHCVNKALILYPEHARDVFNSVGFLKSTGMFCADIFSMMTVSMILDYISKSFAGYVAQQHSVESLWWYLQEKTKIFTVMQDVKIRSLLFDPYSSLLSDKVLAQDKLVSKMTVFSDFVKSLYDAPEGSVYSLRSYIWEKVQKTHLKESEQAVALIDYSFIQQPEKIRTALQNPDFYQRTQQQMQDLLVLYDSLAQELQKLVDFIVIHPAVGQDRLDDFITQANRFLERMEQTTLLSLQEQWEQSKKEQGLFTMVMEYEKMLVEQVDMMHRYCNIKYS